MFWILPNEQDDMEHWFEESYCLRKVVLSTERLEPEFKSAQVFCIIVCFDSSGKYFFAQPSKSCTVCALRLIQGAQYTPYSGSLKLIKNAVQICRLILPKLNFNIRSRMQSPLKLWLRVLLEHTTYLFRPSNNCSFKQRYSVLPSAWAPGKIDWRHG